MCRSRSSLIGGAKKGHGKISRPNPIGKHIQVLQQNPPNTGLECGQPWRPFKPIATFCSAERQRTNKLRGEKATLKCCVNRLKLARPPDNDMHKLKVCVRLRV